MTIEGNWIVGAMKNDFPSVKYAVAELPAGPKGKGTMSFSVCYGVAKASKNKAAATRLREVPDLADQQLAVTKEFPVMPSRKSLADQWLADKPELKAFVAGGDYAKKSVFVPGFKTTIDTLNDGIQGLAKGDRRSTTSSPHPEGRHRGPRLTRRTRPSRRLRRRSAHPSARGPEQSRTGVTGLSPT